MFYLFVPSKWKLRLLVLDCIVLAVTLVQFANHFDTASKIAKFNQTKPSNDIRQDASLDNNVVELNSEKLSSIFEQASDKIDKNTNSDK